MLLRLNIQEVLQVKYQIMTKSISKYFKVFQRESHPWGSVAFLPIAPWLSVRSLIIYFIKCDHYIKQLFFILTSVNIIELLESLFLGFLKRSYFIFININFQKFFIFLNSYFYFKEAVLNSNYSNTANK